MICSVRLFCLIAISLLVSPAISQERLLTKPEDVGVSSEKVGELSEFIQELVDDGRIAGGVTMMARHGKVVHLKAVGMADREAEKPMTTDAIFRIASMTKPITSVAVMMLWEEGKLGLDDPVSKFIPEFKNPDVLVSVDPLKTEPAKREITIRHLLTHTSGVANGGAGKIGPLYHNRRIRIGLQTSRVTLEENMKTLAGLPLLFHPGEGWQYGMSTDVLGRVVEVAAETTLDSFIEDNICKPLGMKDTTFRVPADKRERLVAAYVPVDRGFTRLVDGKIVSHPMQNEVINVSGEFKICGDYPYSPSNRYLSGAAGMCSTADDYMRFCQMLLNGGELNGTPLLKEQTVKMMITNQLNAELIGKPPFGFGFGLGVIPDTNGVAKQLRTSCGWSGFWGTFFSISPRGDWIVITMSQVAPDGTQKPNYFAELAAAAIL